MKILFFGDSITESGRDYQASVDMPQSYGMGYVNFVAAEILSKDPLNNTVINRGEGGDKIVDLYARIRRDVWNLEPDFLSILIGVNDVWHELGFGGGNGVDAEKYFKIYSMLIEEIKEALPDIKIMILEPFTLKGSGNEEYYDVFKAEVLKRAEKAKAVAEKFGLPFIALQKHFDDAAKKAPADMWLRDGVHPTPAGHEIIKREWIKCFKTLG